VVTPMGVAGACIVRKLGATMDRYHSQCKAVPNHGQS
jgi:hypothetical protein